eukprot:Rmarinus@m.9095
MGSLGLLTIGVRVQGATATTSTNANWMCPCVQHFTRCVVMWRAGLHAIATTASRQWNRPLAAQMWTSVQAVSTRALRWKSVLTWKDRLRAFFEKTMKLLWNQHQKRKLYSPIGQLSTKTYMMCILMFALRMQATRTCLWMTPPHFLTPFSALQSFARLLKRAASPPRLC